MRIGNYLVYFSIFILLISMISCQSDADQAKSSEKVVSTKKKKGRKKKKIKPNQKNVLFIYVDDLRPELNCYGASHIHSPNIDQLANNGVQFDNAYCQWAVCGPSRTSLLTGLRPDVSKVYRNKHIFRKNIPDLVTLPQVFKDNGYITKSIGKIYHSLKTSDKKSWSDGSWFGNRELNARGYVLEENQIRSVKNKLGPPTEISEKPDSIYRDGQFANKAIEFLNEHSDKPFFLAVGFEKPHLPFAAPKKYWDLYDINDIVLPSTKKPSGRFKWALNGSQELKRYEGIEKKLPIPIETRKELVHGYYACVSFVDAQIGKVMAELKKLGLDKNTIVVLCGDHGWKLGDYGEWCKKSNFEVDTRTPLIISAPNIESKGIITNEIVEFIDVYPTICELTELKVPNYIQGQSLVPLLKKNQITNKDKIAFSQQVRANNLGYAIRSNDFRFVKWINKKLNKEFYELFDLKNDPKEMVNVAKKEEYKETKAYFNQLLTDSIQSWEKQHQLLTQK